MTSNDISNTRQLLERVSNDDLEPLVEYILKARTESLSKQVDFKRWHPEHRRYASAILDELRLFGGNSFANLWRKSGPSYTEVVRDVAGKLKVKGVGSMELIELEEAMVQSILRQALEKSSGEDRHELEEILREAGLDKTKMTALLNGSALSGLVVPAVARMILYRTSTVIVNSMAQQLLGHGLRSAVVAGGTFAGGRAVAALAGPVGWVIAGVWTAVDLAGPAYRVTIPCVLHIAMLRLKARAEAATDFMNGAFDG